MEISSSELGEAVAAASPMLLVSLIVCVIFAVILFLIFRRGKKGKGTFKNELNYYKENAFNWLEPHYQQSGNVSVRNNNIYYSRGNKTIRVDATIEKVTYLSSKSVSEWFVGRNYNLREETAILNDIQNYLIQNKICKKVIINEEEEIS